MPRKEPPSDSQGSVRRNCWSALWVELAWPARWLSADYEDGKFRIPGALELGPSPAGRAPGGLGLTPAMADQSEPPKRKGARLRSTKSEAEEQGLTLHAHCAGTLRAHAASILARAPTHCARAPTHCARALRRLLDRLADVHERARPAARPVLSLSGRPRDETMRCCTRRVPAMRQGVPRRRGNHTAALQGAGAISKSGLLAEAARLCGTRSSCPQVRREQDARDHLDSCPARNRLQLSDIGRDDHVATLKAGRHRRAGLLLAAVRVLQSGPQHTRLLSHLFLTFLHAWGCGSLNGRTY